MKCPRCHKEVPLENTTMITCPKCKREFINEDIDEAFGVRRVDTIKDGIEVASYETTGDKFEKFPSWYCLKFFDTYEEREEHDKKHHKTRDFMVGCIPSGSPEDFKPECDDDFVSEEIDEHLALFGKRASEVKYGESCPICNSRIDEFGYCACEAGGS